MIEATTIAYVAGILDTVGRFRVEITDEGTRLPHVGASSPNLPVLRYLAGLTGVTVTDVVRRYDRLGCGEHCTEPHLHVDSVTGRWQLVGYRATVVLAAVVPYLRGPETETAVALLDLGLGATHKPQTAAAMTRLGWPPPSPSPRTDLAPPPPPPSTPTPPPRHPPD
jgi:hypothetical protein